MKEWTFTICPLLQRRLYGFRALSEDSAFLADILYSIHGQFNNPLTLQRVLEWQLQEQVGQGDESPSDYRWEALRTLGITDAETIPKDIVGPLDDLKASNLLRGPFNIKLTQSAAEHLTFRGPHSHSTLRLLGINEIFKVYHIHRSGIARYEILKCLLIPSVLGVSTVFLKLLNSHVLFFGRYNDLKSEEIGERIGVDMAVVREYRNKFASIEDDFRLQDFPVYGRRLENVQRKMNEWRPHTLRELAIRPYNDPVAFLCVLVRDVGIVSILLLGTSLAQMCAAFKALHH